MERACPYSSQILSERPLRDLSRQAITSIQPLTNEFSKQNYYIAPCVNC